jgi:hypothetical protein
MALIDWVDEAHSAFHRIEFGEELLASPGGGKGWKRLAENLGIVGPGRFLRGGARIGGFAFARSSERYRGDG